MASEIRVTAPSPSIVSLVSELLFAKLQRAAAPYLCTCSAKASQTLPGPHTQPITHPPCMVNHGSSICSNMNSIYLISKFITPFTTSFKSLTSVFSISHTLLQFCWRPVGFFFGGEILCNEKEDHQAATPARDHETEDRHAATRARAAACYDRFAETAVPAFAATR